MDVCYIVNKVPVYVCQPAVAVTLTWGACGLPARHTPSCAANVPQLDYSSLCFLDYCAPTCRDHRSVLGLLVGTARVSREASTRGGLRTGADTPSSGRPRRSTTVDRVHDVREEGHRPSLGKTVEKGLLHGSRLPTLRAAVPASKRELPLIGLTQYKRVLVPNPNSGHSKENNKALSRCV